MASQLPSSGNQDDFPAMSQINITPFVDVVLVLLVIFMVTAPIVLKDQLQVKLPKSSTSDQSSVPPLSISVTENGDYLLYGKPTNEAELKLKVSEAVKLSPDAQAILSADTNARHGYVVKLIDLVKSQGLNRFAIEVEKSNP